MNIQKNKDEFIISFNYNAKLVEEVKSSLEKRRFDFDSKQWICKNTARNRFVLDFLQGKKPYERFKQIPPELPSSKYGLWKHQNWMFLNLYKRHHIIAGQMRTGKTKPVLFFISELYKLGKVKETPWFITTKSAISGIKNELTKWNIEAKIVLMTHRAFSDLLGDKDLKQCKDIIPNIIVYDEAHKLKNPSSIIGSTARQLSDIHEEIYPFDSYRFLLSGTPAPKSPSDWWNLCEIACPGYLKENNIYEFNKRYGEWKKAEGLYGEYPKLIKWKAEEVEKLNTRLKDIRSVYFKKECLDLPDILYNKIKLNVDSSYKKYVALINTTYTKAITKLSALRALSDGFIYHKEYDELSGVTKIDATYLPNNPKVSQLKEDLEEYEEIGRAVIYAGFTASVDSVVGTCLEAGWTVLRMDGRGSKVLGAINSVEECLKEMDGSLNQGNIEKLVVVAQTDAASTGLEFSASPVIIYFSNSFNGANREQSEARPHSSNMNKERGLEIRDYIHLDTDEYILENLKAKRFFQSISLGEIDEQLRKIL